MDFMNDKSYYDYEIDLWNIGSHGIRVDLEKIQQVVVEAFCETKPKENKTVDIFVGVRVFVDEELKKTITLTNFSSGGMLSKYGNDRAKNQLEFAISLVHFISKQIELNNVYPSPFSEKIQKKISSDVGIVDLNIPNDFINNCVLPYKYAVDCIRFEESQFETKDEELKSRVEKKKKRHLSDYIIDLEDSFYTSR